MKNIFFNSFGENANVTGYPPSPAKNSIPSWFKKMPKHIDNKLEIRLGEPNLTIKACPPFLDSMMNGYIIYTEYDLYVSKQEDGITNIQWRYGGDLISMHGTDQVHPEQIPAGFSVQPFKFNNFWQIVTPPNYSTLFTHPLNRSDLPFMTISGVVETDRYKNIINFPFLIKEDFEGIIPAGTPIVQLMPFKREGWKMKLGEVSKKEINRELAKLAHKIMGGYKNQWWVRKEYR